MKKILSMALAALLLVGTLGGCSSSGGENGKLVLYTWENMFPQEVLDGFTQETGISVTYSNFDTDETMLARLEAAEGGDYDLVIADDYIIETAIQEGLVQELDTSKLENYYVFGNQSGEDLAVGVRDSVEEDANKRNKTDFVLWFTKSKFEDQELKWDSPWGLGYPGWHIECSAISVRELGEYLDIHCGGIDNAFPHHTNEIAQSEAYLGHPWCKYWFHVLHLNDARGKMSKSKGGFLTVSLLEEKGYDPLAYRFFCLQSHYRKGLVFSWENLDNAAQAYQKLVARIATRTRTCTIALVGKYVALHDAYLSVAEALTHGGIENGVKVAIRWVDSETVTDENASQLLAGCDGVLVPGGFGSRGVEGKISAIRYAREQKVPFLGICLGMQMAVVEFARHVCGLTGAQSGEFAPDGKYPVIDLMPDQVGITDKGGTMRLGSYPCELAEDSFAARAYGASRIDERHRHRYEFNNDFREALTAAGLRLAGLSPDGRLVEIVEIGDHPWFVGVQFHPELKSRPNRAHPLFREFIAAAKKLNNQQ